MYSPISTADFFEVKKQKVKIGKAPSAVDGAFSSAGRPPYILTIGDGGPGWVNIAKTGGGVPPVFLRYSVNCWRCAVFIPAAIAARNRRNLFFMVCYLPFTTRQK